MSLIIIIIIDYFTLELHHLTQTGESERVFVAAIISIIITTIISISISIGCGSVWTKVESRGGGRRRPGVFLQHFMVVGIDTGHVEGVGGNSPLDDLVQGTRPHQRGRPADVITGC